MDPLALDRPKLRPSIDTVQAFLDVQWSHLRPIATFPETASVRRINVITDSIGPSSLFGGVGTSLILGSLWAARTGATLRIVTRTEPPESTALGATLAANGVSFEGRTEFHFSPHQGGRELPLGPGDLFLSTAWWTTRSLLNTVPADRIVYLLQEDERMFYPLGDEHLACAQTLAEPLRLTVINTNLLFQYMTTGDAAIAGLAERSIFFEPAFSDGVRNEDHSDRKRNLFFYARPTNARNLYLTGIAMIENAVLRGVLNPERWRVHLVGHNLRPLEFSNGLEAVFHAPMDWANYQSFLATMDAGLSLMYTPHPSYPPFDLAALGIPALTNRFEIKTDLSDYSENVVCADLSESGLLDGMSQLLDLAEDRQRCLLNRERDGLQRNWSIALEPVVAELAKIAS